MTQDKPLRPHEEGAFRLFTRKCVRNKELVAEFNRLHKASVGITLSPIVQAIDLATGKAASDLASFMGFIVDQWGRLPAEARKELEDEACSTPSTESADRSHK